MRHINWIKDRSDLKGIPKVKERFMNRRQHHAQSLVGGQRRMRNARGRNVPPSRPDAKSRYCVGKSVTASEPSTIVCPDRREESPT